MCNNSTYVFQIWKIESWPSICVASPTIQSLWTEKIRMQLIISQNQTLPFDFELHVRFLLCTAVWQVTKAEASISPHHERIRLDKRRPHRTSQLYCSALQLIGWWIIFKNFNGSLWRLWRCQRSVSVTLTSIATHSSENVSDFQGELRTPVIAKAMYVNSRDNAALFSVNSKLSISDADVLADDVHAETISSALQRWMWKSSFDYPLNESVASWLGQRQLRIYSEFPLIRVGAEWMEENWN